MIPDVYKIDKKIDLLYNTYIQKSIFSYYICKYIEYIYL